MIRLHFLCALLALAAWTVTEPALAQSSSPGPSFPKRPPPPDYSSWTREELEEELESTGTEDPTGVLVLAGAMMVGGAVTLGVGAYESTDCAYYLDTVDDSRCGGARTKIAVGGILIGASFAVAIPAGFWLGSQIRKRNEIRRALAGAAPRWGLGLARVPAGSGLRFRLLF